MLLQTRPDPSPAAHERVYRGLRTRIMHGEIPPGESMTLRGIGKQFGVSMTPAREAIRRLVAEGALTMSSSGRVSTPEITNDRIEELAALRSLLGPNPVMHQHNATHRNGAGATNQSVRAHAFPDLPPAVRVSNP